MKLIFKGKDEYIDIKIHDGETGNLTDPDSPPQFSIYDPNNQFVCGGIGIRVGLGRYRAYFRIKEENPYGIYNIIWEASVRGTPIRNQIDQFEVISYNSVDITQNIEIEHQWLSQIKAIIGYPNLDNFVVSDEQIKEFAIFPAMYQYFLRFPIEHREQKSVSGHTELNFPDFFTFGIVEIRVVNKGYLNKSNLGPLDFMIYKNMYQPFQWGSYGSNYDFNGMSKLPIYTRELYNTLKNYANFNYSVDYHNRKVIVNTDRAMDLYISWAKYSLNFNDILYEFKMDVIRLAQSFLLLYLSDTFSIITDENLSRRVNVESLKSRAEDMQTKIMEKWDALAFPILLRF